MTTDHGVVPMIREAQRITVSGDMVAGPLAEAAVAERLLAIVIGELRAGGIMIAALRIGVHGLSTSR